jgi:hypothetical protein
MTESRFCNYCKTEHLLTSEYWYRLENSPRCKTKAKATVKIRQVEKLEDYQNYQKAYRQSNYGKLREYDREYKKEYHKRKYSTDQQYRLAMLLRNRLRLALRSRKKVGSHVGLLGCTIEELVIHLEGQFTEGMTWENHNPKGWHIDHRIPLAAGDLTDENWLKIVLHYRNLQPLWAEENLKKKDRQDGVFEHK